MTFYGLDAEEKLSGDFTDTKALAQKLENLKLAVGQPPDRRGGRGASAPATWCSNRSATFSLI